MTATRNHETVRMRIDAWAKPESPRHWGQLAVLLLKVEDTKAWVAEGASSFSDWLVKQTEPLDVRKASLWRYRSSGRRYLDHRYRLAGLPALEALPRHVGPESLELLFKLERVLSRDECDQLLADLVAGKITRGDLRTRWQAYRPMMGGRTARGRNKEEPRLNAEEARHLIEARKAKIRLMLSNRTQPWLQALLPPVDPRHWPRRSALPGEPVGPWRLEPLDGVNPMPGKVGADRVIGVHRDNGRALILHGFWIVGESHPTENGLIDELTELSSYFDEFWVVIHDEATRKAWMGAMAEVPWGLLMYVSDTLCVQKRAQQAEGEAMDHGPGYTARLLLLHGFRGHDEHGFRGHDDEPIEPDEYDRRRLP